MTRIPEVKYKEVGNIDRVRACIESGFKQCKSELGWADFRVTKYGQIQKWWELVMSAYLMSCLHNKFLNLNFNPAPEFCQNHQLWDERTSGKSGLNNLRLI